MKAYVSRFIWLLLILSCVSLFGCSGSGDYDHKPAVGFGTLIVDNLTSDDIEVFVDSVQILKVRDGHDEFYDLAPGTYRIVLAEDGGSQSYIDEIDVLEGRQTILEVSPSFGDSYDVSVRIVEP